MFLLKFTCCIVCLFSLSVIYIVWCKFSVRVLFFSRINALLCTRAQMKLIPYSYVLSVYLKKTLLLYVTRALVIFKYHQNALSLLVVFCVVLYYCSIMSQKSLCTANQFRLCILCYPKYFCTSINFAFRFISQELYMA